MLTIEKVLHELTLKEDMHAAEFGCGTADFAVQLALKLRKGKVYALDIQEEKIHALKGRIAREGIANIAPILSDLEADKGSKLPDACLDLVLMPNVLFQSENKLAIMREAYRVLKPNGQLLVLDWLKKVHAGHGEHIVTPDEVKNMAAGLALMLKKEFAPGDYHYALVFTK